MIIGGHLIFKKGCGPLWIKKDDENGLLDIPFWTESGAEVILSFDPGSFENFASMVGKFQRGEEAKNVKTKDAGAVESAMTLDLRDEEIQFKIDLYGSLGEDEIGPDLLISGKGFKLSLGFSLNQTREIKAQLEKVISILEGLESVQVEKTVPAS